MRKEKTLKQKWSYERLFQNAGTLARVIGCLNSLANSKSTLPIEKQLLINCRVALYGLNMRKLNKESWEQYRGDFK